MYQKTASLELFAIFGYFLYNAPKFSIFLTGAAFAAQIQFLIRLNCINCVNGISCENNLLKFFFHKNAMTKN